MKLFSSLIFSLIISWSFGQDLDVLSRYLNSEKIGEKQTQIDTDSTIYETTYLGEITTKSGEVFHILSQFYSVKAAISRHGHSRIVFMNQKKRVEKIYVLEMPFQLPLVVSNNHLVFQNGKLALPELPPRLCIPEESCYEASEQW